MSWAQGAPQAWMWLGIGCMHKSSGGSSSEGRIARGANSGAKRKCGGAGVKNSGASMKKMVALHAKMLGA
jgi:hypothetical protein